LVVEHSAFEQVRRGSLLNLSVSLPEPIRLLRKLFSTAAAQSGRQTLKSFLQCSPAVAHRPSAAAARRAHMPNEASAEVPFKRPGEPNQSADLDVEPPIRKEALSAYSDKTKLAKRKFSRHANVECHCVSVLIDSSPPRLNT
jgi:hypothetical protein